MPLRAVRGVLFVDLGNTCRSVFAQYFAQQHPTERLPTSWIESAGIDDAQPPDPASPAVATLHDVFHIDASSHCPRCVRYLPLNVFRYVVAIDNPDSDEVAHKMTQRGVDAERLRRWLIADPWGNRNAYKACADDVLRALTSFRAADFA